MIFEELNNKYNGANDNDKIGKLSKHYASRKAETLMDAMLSAIGISTLVDGNTIDYDAITPQMAEAFNLSFPNMSINELEGVSAEYLQGIISNWKGKLFEVQVRDQLNSGEIVGDVVLEEGQTAVLAESINQPGWDLQILNGDGTVDNFLQLKATESIGYINQALEKYPDIDILATSEVASLSENLHNSDISLEDINEPLLDVLDGGEDFLDMLVPGLPFLIIAVGEGRKAFVKKTEWDQSIINMVERGVKTGLAMSLGWLVFDFTGISWLGVLFSGIFRWYMNYLERDEKIIKLLPIAKKQNEEILLLKQSYE